MLSRGQKLEKLNQQLHDNPNLKLFKEVQEYIKKPVETIVGGYLIGLVYSTYKILYDIKTSTDLESVDLKYSIFRNNSVFGSVELLQFISLYEYLFGKSINPVYYLSTIFNSAWYFRHNNPNSVMIMPKTTELLSEKSLKAFKKTYDYDHNAYQQQDVRYPQETVAFAKDNVLLRFAQLYFRLMWVEGVDDVDKALNDYYREVVRDLYFRMSMPSSLYRASDFEDKYINTVSYSLFANKKDVNDDYLNPIYTVFTQGLLKAPLAAMDESVYQEFSDEGNYIDRPSTGMYGLIFGNTELQRKYLTQEFEYPTQVIEFLKSRPDYYVHLDDYFRVARILGQLNNVSVKDYELPYDILDIGGTMNTYTISKNYYDRYMEFKPKTHKSILDD